VSSTVSRSSHLLFLDGIRGLTALYVVMHHVYQWIFVHQHGKRLPAWFRIAHIFDYGHLAVGIFIVLSGFCLMLPVARSGSDQLPRGLKEFLQRRARRILPPYYAALVLSVLMLMLLPALQTTVFGPQEYHLYAKSAMPGAIASHLVMLHNLNQEWIYRINGPLWSVATEWQIYFLFPLLLLPLWRRFGLVTTIIIGFTVGVATISLGLIGACYWYLGLFAMGMAGAVISSSPKSDSAARNFPWGLSAVVVMPVCIAATTRPAPGFMVAADFLIGLATMCALIHYTIQARRSTASVGLRFLSSSPAVRLGAFSYSLYLIHLPLVVFAQTLLNKVPLSIPMDFLILTAIGVPAIMAIAYAFHFVFERPFLNTPVRRQDRKVVPIDGILPAERTL
jgi:peptidoglycan/LPS O-acetylase OafA/YrhL